MLHLHVSREGRKTPPPGRRRRRVQDPRRVGVRPSELTVLREFFRHVPAAVAMLDRHMRYVMVSRRWLEDYRLRDADIIGRSHYEVFPEVPERWKDAHRRALAGETLRNDEDCFQRADGAVDWVSWEVRPWYAADGGIGGIILYTQVITARKQTEDALRASEQRFRQLSESAPIAIFEMDAQGCCTYVNRRWEEITGRHAEEGMGHGWRQTIHPEERERQFEAALRAMRTGQQEPAEMRILRPDGGVRWVRAYAAPIADAQGHTTGFVGTLDDITPVKEAEERLRASEERFMTLVNSNIVGIVLADMSGGVLKANDAFLQMVGYSREDLDAGMIRWNEMTPPEYAAADERALADLRREGVASPYEKEYRRRDGRRVPVLVGAARLGRAGGETVAFVLDLSERKRMEARLRAANEELSTYARVIDESPDFISVVDRDYAYRMVNPTYCRMNAMPTEWFVGHTPVDTMGEETFERLVRPRLDQCFAGQSVQYEAWFDYRAVGCRYVDVRYYPLFVDGHVEAAVVIGRDITERKEAEDARERARKEIERLNAELTQASTAKDQFLAVLSHELRNPLAPILAGVDVLARRLPENARVQQTLEIIARNVKLQARLVDDLLDLSRVARGRMQLERVPVELGAVVRTAVEDQRAEAAKAGLLLNVSTTPGLWVSGDLGRLQQAVLNLLTNAIKFTPSGEIRVASFAPDARHARIVVEDTGVGIDPAFLPHLFDMFRQGEVGGRRRPGLGIGLALVKAIVEEHGGRVWAESEGPGKGSRFTVELPLIAGPGAQPPSED